MAVMEQGDGLGPALARLYQRRSFGIKPGLAVVRQLCALVGNPQDDLAAIHIAGTNGKGSTAAMIEAVLRQAGLRPGLYTSPHLVRFNERVRLNGVDAEDAVLADALARCEAVAPQVLAAQGQEPTFFEVATVMAFLCMQQAGIRLAVIETGLGGRLDATNVLKAPLVSVITRIGMDHEQYLGNTLAAIAGEKAGIIKAGRPVVSAPQAPEAAEVLRAVAAERKAPLVFAEDAVAVEGGHRSSGTVQRVRIETRQGWSGQVTLPLPGLHQRENLGVAIAALELVCDPLGLELGMDGLRSGLQEVRWPARMAYLREGVLLDAAHNPDGAAALVRSLRAQDWRRVVLVSGMCSDKNVREVVRQFADVVTKVFCCRIPGDRGLDPDALAALYAAERVAAVVVEDPRQALAAAETYAREVDLPVVIAGSIFLAGAFLA